MFCATVFDNARHGARATPAAAVAGDAVGSQPNWRNSFFSSSPLLWRTE